MCRIIRHKDVVEGDAKKLQQVRCLEAAKKLQQVLKYIHGQGKKEMLLRDFALSASCSKATCYPICLMFRRVRRHVVGHHGPCAVLRLYAMLLKLHVAKCTKMDCGLPACPALQKTRKRDQRQAPGDLVVEERGLKNL